MTGEGGEGAVADVTSRNPVEGLLVFLGVYFKGLNRIKVFIIINKKITSILP